MAHESIRLRVRVSKKDSAFVYAVLEAQEGWCLYSTLPSEDSHARYRDLELLITPPFFERVRELLLTLDAELELLA